MSTDFKSKQQQLYLYLIGLIFIFATSYFVEKYVALQNHNLLQAQKWHSLKTLRSQNFPGGTSNSILTERTTLSQEELHLDLWGGYNDLIDQDPIKQLENYQIKFNLKTPQSFLLIYLDCSFEACWAYRASRSPLYKSGLLLISHSGQFLEKKLSEHLYQYGEQIFELRHEGADSYKVYINHQVEHEIKYNLPFKFIRFSSGLNDVVIQNITLEQNGQDVQRFQFKAPFHFDIFSIVFFSLFIVAYLMFNQKIKPRIIAWSLAIIFTGSFVTYKYDKSISSLIKDLNSQSTYLTQTTVFSFLGLSQNNQTIDQNHFAVIDSSQKLLVFKKDLSSFFRDKKVQQSLRIAVIGGAQAWGVGATAAENTWASRFVKNLKPNFKKPIVAVNFSQIGAQAKDFKVRAHSITDFKPQLAIIHFGYNDSATKVAELEKTLKNIVIEFKKLNIKIVVSVEPLNLNFSSDEISQALFIENFSTLHGIDVLHPNEKLNESITADSGLLWIDEIHLTDYGQEVLAQYLADEVIKLKLF